MRGSVKKGLKVTKNPYKIFVVGCGRRDGVWGAFFEGGGIILVPAILLLVYHVIYLFTPPAFGGYSSSLPQGTGGLRLSRPGCLVLRRGGLPFQRWSPTQALTGPSVTGNQLH